MSPPGCPFLPVLPLSHQVSRHSAWHRGGDPTFPGHPQPVCVLGNVEVWGVRIEQVLFLLWPLLASKIFFGRDKAVQGNRSSLLGGRGQWSLSALVLALWECGHSPGVGAAVPALGSLDDLTLRLPWLHRLQLSEPSYSLPLPRAWPDTSRQPHLLAFDLLPRLTPLGVCPPASVHSLGAERKGTPAAMGLSLFY
jgi:hypothetical protein